MMVVKTFLIFITVREVSSLQFLFIEYAIVQVNLFPTY